MYSRKHLPILPEKGIRHVNAANPAWSLTLAITDSWCATGFRNFAMVPRVRERNKTFEALRMSATLEERVHHWTHSFDGDVH